MISQKQSSSIATTTSTSPSRRTSPQQREQQQQRRFRHHDSTFSVSDDYHYYNHTTTSSVRTVPTSNIKDDDGVVMSSPSKQQRSATNENRNKAAVPDLNVWQGACLLVADQMGTGLLALPHDITVLGVGFGLGFLVANLPINLYAGTILCGSAEYVEKEQSRANTIYEQQQQHQHSLFIQPGGLLKEHADDNDEDTALLKQSTTNNTAGGYSAVVDGRSRVAGDDELDEFEDNDTDNYDVNSLTEIGDDDDVQIMSVDKIDDDRVHGHGHGRGHALHHDTATFDFIGMTSALFFDPTSVTASTTTTKRKSRINDATFWVMILFYTNIFLVLGNYIVVMAHAVSALVGEDLLCVPTAGLLASTLMFAVSQLRTMARLGRAASVVSLSALAIVVAQCLYFCRIPQQQLPEQQPENVVAAPEDVEDTSTSLSFFSPTTVSILLKLSATGSIGFAVGSQKLLLNIRHEFANRSEAPQSLAMSLLVIGTCYVFIIVAAGPNPPGFLFDAIPQGSVDRRIAGFLLWIHVVVSYAINSQAICSSMDRIFFYDWNVIQHWSERRRWMMITGITSASAFFVANAIPFFKDLVAFIGALTSVPLTLLLPAVYNRRINGVPVWLPGLECSWQNIGSYCLLVYSSLFMVSALAGSVYSILSDWRNHTGGFFSCH
jgi:amino acid permease